MSEEYAEWASSLNDSGNSSHSSRRRDRDYNQSDADSDNDQKQPAPRRRTAANERLTMGRRSAILSIDVDSGSDSDRSTPSRKRRRDVSSSGRKKRGGQELTVSLVPRQATTLVPLSANNTVSNSVHSNALDPFFANLPPPCAADRFCLVCHRFIEGPSVKGMAVRQKIYAALDRYSFVDRQAVTDGVRHVYQEEYRISNKAYAEQHPDMPELWPEWTARSIMDHIENHGSTAPHRVLRQDVNDLNMAMNVCKRGSVKVRYPSGKERIDDDGIKMLLKMLQTKVTMYNTIARMMG